MGESKMGSEAFESMGKGATSPRAQRDGGEGQPALREDVLPSPGQPCGLDTVVPAAKGHIHTQRGDEDFGVLWEPAFHTNPGPLWSLETEKPPGGLASGTWRPGLSMSLTLR